MPAEDGIGEGVGGRSEADLIDRRPIRDVPIREIANELRQADDVESDASRKRRIYVERALAILDAGEDAGVRLIPLPDGWNFRDLLDAVGRPHIWGRDPIADMHVVAARWDAQHPIHVRDFGDER